MARVHGGCLQVSFSDFAARVGQRVVRPFHMDGQPNRPFWPAWSRVAACAALLAAAGCGAAAAESVDRALRVAESAVYRVDRRVAPSYRAAARDALRHDEAKALELMQPWDVLESSISRATNAIYAARLSLHMYESAGNDAVRQDIRCAIDALRNLARSLGAVTNAVYAPELDDAAELLASYGAISCQK